MLNFGNIEDQEVVQAWRWTRTAVSVMCEFKVIGMSWQTEHHAVVSGVIGKTIEFRKAKAIPIKADDLLQAIGRPRDTNLRDEDLICECQWGDISR